MDYAIGDIHGCLDKVLRLLDVLRYDPAADRLIFLGDYIDRGRGLCSNGTKSWEV